MLPDGGCACSPASSTCTCTNPARGCSCASTSTSPCARPAQPSALSAHPGRGTRFASARTSAAPSLPCASATSDHASRAELTAHCARAQALTYFGCPATCCCLPTACVPGAPSLACACTCTCCGRSCANASACCSSKPSVFNKTESPFHQVPKTSLCSILLTNVTSNSNPRSCVTAVEAKDPLWS